MSGKPNNTREKPSLFNSRTAIMLVLLAGLGIGGIKCMESDAQGEKTVPMYDDDPESPLMTESQKKEFDRQRCLIKQDTVSGILRCYFGSDEESGDGDELEERGSKKPERKGKKEKKKKNAPHRSRPSGGGTAFG